MSVSEKHIRETFHSYLQDWPEDTERLGFFDRVLDRVGSTLTSRKEFYGHVTASAVVINDDSDVLLVHRLGAKRWLLPGGHLEVSDRSLIDAALRELEEQTGVFLHEVAPLSSLPLDIDIHNVNPDVEHREPGHVHIDFRYAFRAGLTVVRKQPDEVAWRDISAIGDWQLRERTAACVSALVPAPAECGRP